MNEKSITAFIGRSYGINMDDGIAKLTPYLMNELNIKNGDVISITGNKKIYVQAYEMDSNDIFNQESIFDSLFNTTSLIDNLFNNSINNIYKKNDKIILINAHTRDAIGAYINQEVKIQKENPNISKKLYLKSKIPIEIYINKDKFQDVLKEKLLNRVVLPNTFIYYNQSPFSNEIPFIVENTDPSGPTIITKDTEVILSNDNISFIDNNENTNSINNINENKNNFLETRYEDIGGLNRELDKIREVVELPLTFPDLFQKAGIEPPKGILLYGPPGTGKTLIARAIANETKSKFIQISGPEIMSKYYGESEQQLRNKFEEAEKNAPSIIFIDEIDSIAPKRGETQGETERRIVAQLLTLMDGMKSRGKVIVIATTNRPDSIDEALRRGGRFDREIEIGVPDKDGRLQILKIHTKNMPLLLKENIKNNENNIYEENSFVNLENIAEITHGYVGSDISSLCKEAAMNSIRRVIPSIKKSKDTSYSKDIINKLRVTKEDFEKALLEMEPSAMREVFVEVPKVKWEDIGGLTKEKQELIESIKWPLKYPRVFKELNIKPPKGILLYGPPGTGKTMMAKAAANESGANFISIKGPELFNKYVGETEKNIRMIFKRAKQTAPTILFFDEIDSIAPIRSSDSSNHVQENAVSQILTEMDGIEDLKDVIIIAATNRPDIIDPALLRPGRFDRLIYVKPPDKENRKRIFEVHLKGKKISENVSIDYLSSITEGYVGADIDAICREATMIALRELIHENSTKDHVYDNMEFVKITESNFEDAIKKIKPTVSSKNSYNKITEDFSNIVYN